LSKLEGLGSRDDERHDLEVDQGDDFDAGTACQKLGIASEIGVSLVPLRSGSGANARTVARC
jgi:hypothetical protein